MRQPSTVALQHYASFNPRTRDGCDVYFFDGSLSEPSFNPRTRDGCDIEITPIDFVVLVSIHAPVMGATRQAGK